MPFAIAMAHLKREESGGVAMCQGMKWPRISGSYSSEGEKWGRDSKGEWFPMRAAP
jgi:hypothetical protein